MSELIDRQALIKQLKDENIPFNADINEIINIQPIAFDVANIVEKLEYEKERHEKDRAYWSDKPWKDSCVYNEYDMADRKIDCYDDAINIVKQEINNGLE